MKAKKGLQSKESIFTSELTQRTLPQKMVITSRHIEQSGYLRCTLLVKNFPATIESDFLLTHVAQIKNTTFSMRLKPMDQGTTIRLVDKQINNATAGTYKRKGTQQLEAASDKENIVETYKEFLRKKGRFYYVNIYIEVYGEDEELLKERVKEVTNALAGCHITAEQLIYEQKEGYLGVSPIGKDTLTMSANNIPSDTLATMYLFSYSSRNDPLGMLLGKTRDGGHMFLDLWIRSLETPNGNFFIVGESGYGKSFVLKKICSQQIACGTWVFMIDPEDEYRHMFRRLGGTVINCAAGKLRINPFEIRRLKGKQEDEEAREEWETGDDPDFEEPEAFRQDQSFFQHLSWLQDFYKILIPYANGKEISALMALTRDMYIRYGIDQNTDLSKLRHEDYPTFTDLYTFIEDVLKDKGRKKYSFYDMITDDTLRDVLLMIKDTYDGSLSPLFNGHTNITNTNLINFNIQELLEGSQERTQAFLFNVLTYLWGRIVKREHRIMLCVDELYLLMDRDNISIAKYLRSFIKRARKYNAIIGTATQQINDLDDEKIRHISSAIINSATYKFLFNPGDLAFEQTKRMLHLTEGEAESIFDSVRGQCLLKAGKTDKYNVNVGKLPYEEDLFGSAGG